ncbi:MAG: TetR/AcrR family transcriptional regulator [Clostridium sp.]|jgi:AcrR family transcriptional regulator|uniref:TetR/AcrR family transcriptional regulator n=1 Tax=Clostridium sp. TaxID=1506 RepID=UPI0025B9D6EA|nr:TetR/AcrR family transcriptional regulator [Clostridium sp.]MCH3963677.1 TetR/AcrR family transcriptional regulator [Clostridium sp.]MCI1714818.1 TetR/AcrR family transcriptional regulator [Clostridium sp.]MCI1798993.1 TetR/AcrR family transcriptional regulator [Clostridium sp.]MCI1813001.1 TetR/AcrR family transcriptional regulator [Clostridium sp.]MCI1869891.1 TetR/AcrR family transcriptional regulator [Clostridium sp.]
MKGDNRSKILKCSKKIINDCGIKFLSVDRIVKECRISKSTFYDNFYSKQKLLESLKMEADDKLEYKPIKDKIVSAAIQEFSTNTFNETNMDIIAQKIGINRSSIYRYFSNKEELLEASVANEMKNRKKILGSIKNRKYDPIVFIEKYIEYFDSYANDKYTNLLFATMIYYSKDNQNVKESFGKLRKYSVDLLADNFEEGKRKKIFKKNFDSVLKAQMLFSVMAGMHIHCPEKFSVVTHDLLKMLYKEIKL